MSTQLDANALVDAGLLDCSGPPATAERFCTDLVVRVLGHDLASGATVLKLTEKARWYDLGGYGSLRELAESLDGAASADHPDYLTALREGGLTVDGAAPSGGSLTALSLSGAFLGLLLIDLTPGTTITPSGRALLAKMTSQCLTGAQYAHPSGAGRNDHLDGSFFSPRQLEVLALVAEGKSNTEIGRKLSISASLAKLEVTFLMHALGARNRLDAVVQAQRSGLLPTEIPGVSRGVVSEG